ncbi:hypothetical protein CHS0354_012180 [Potamilus streckersoni]|uniref:Uncharacterized protein n=1 Tax=Potamilus streckersoni TaxID=2493646 RepID=A0AAE0SAF8_9BIVA|nr:hypothetical protein CHS0354_012180 [Potamilus streckersoni]
MTDLSQAISKETKFASCASLLTISSGSVPSTTKIRLKMVSFKKIEVDNRPQLKEQAITVQDINSNRLHVYGLIDADIKMNEKTFNYQFLVCDITEEGIIGQDLLLRFVDKIDYKGLRLITGIGDISCWIVGEAEMISRVTVRRTTQLQANTVTWVLIHVLKSEFLAEDGIIEVSHKRQHCNEETDKKLGCSDTTVQVKSRAITRNEAVDKESALSVRQELLCGWEPSEVRNRQLEDPNIAPIMVAMDDGCARPEWQRIAENSSSLKTLWRQWNRLELHGRMLYRRWFDETNDCSKLQLIVP